MRGDIVFRVYGVHEGRETDSFFGAFRSRAEAEAEVRSLQARQMRDRNWAAQYHNRGFVIREHQVSTDFEVPSRPKPREKYVAIAEEVTAPETWGTTRVEVFRRQGTTGLERVCQYPRDYAMLQTFEPFRQGTREFALISRDYTRTSVVDLASGQVVAEERPDVDGRGFCPVGFYVPDWWDVNDGSVVPGSEYWDADDEWPVGDFGFVWGCYWGDDTSWKIQYLDLSRIQEGILARDDRFGYVELATSHYVSPCLILREQAGESQAGTAAASRPPDFIHVWRESGATKVRFSVELDFDLGTGRANEEQLARLVRREASR